MWNNYDFERNKRNTGRTTRMLSDVVNYMQTSHDLFRPIVIGLTEQHLVCMKRLLLEVVYVTPDKSRRERIIDSIKWMTQRAAESNNFSYDYMRFPDELQCSAVFVDHSVLEKAFPMVLSTWTKYDLPSQLPEPKDALEEEALQETVSIKWVEPLSDDFMEKQRLVWAEAARGTYFQTTRNQNWKLLHSKIIAGYKEPDEPGIFYETTPSKRR